MDDAHSLLCAADGEQMNVHIIRKFEGVIGRSDFLIQICEIAFDRSINLSQRLLRSVVVDFEFMEAS